MNKKIIAGSALVILATAGTLTYATSTTTGTGNVLKNAFSGMHRSGSGGINAEHFNKRGGGMKSFGRENRQFGIMNSSEGFGFMGKGEFKQLTDVEKTKLATMTPKERQAFMEAKMTEQKALRDAKEAVIDKLINGETLSDTEKVTLETIKTERATAKANRLAQEVKMTEVKVIMEKVKAGTTLTAEEQAKIDAFRTTMKQSGNRGRGGHRMRR